LTSALRGLNIDPDMSLAFRYLPTASAAINIGYRALRMYLGNGSLKAWAAAGEHHARRLRGEPCPTFVTVAATYRCQCRCEHCYSDSPTRPREGELSTAELRSVLREIRGLGAMAVHFSGGEPLLREDLFELVAHARALGLLTRVNSNGLLLNDDNVRRLKDAGLTECGVSLDSADPDVHDRFRGTPGLHERAVRGIRTLVRHGVPCRIMTVASRESIPDGLERTIALGRDLGARYMYILIPIATGAWTDAGGALLTDAERARIRELQDLTFAHLEMPTAGTNCCVYRKDLLYVSANGNVTPCAFVPFVLGNCRERPLAEIWRRHCEGLSLECRGDCPMNIPNQREALRRHVEETARDLRRPEAPGVAAR
jgi:MoaA/NifB/PqqE/SkfB family radical SAM enzyme